MADLKTATQLVHGACFIIDSTPINNPDLLHIVRQHDHMVFSEETYIQ